VRPLVISHRDYDGASVALHGDPCGRAFGVFHAAMPSLIRRGLPKRIREDLACWAAIQKERRRLKLPPLTDEEMPIG